jgi:hypothetical protein
MIIMVFGGDVKVFGSDVKVFGSDVEVFGRYIKVIGSETKVFEGHVKVFGDDVTVFGCDVKAFGGDTRVLVCDTKVFRVISWCVEEIPRHLEVMSRCFGGHWPGGHCQQVLLCWGLHASLQCLDQHKTSFGWSARLPKP